MIHSFIITIGGPHSAADWGAKTAEQIVDIAEHLSGARLAQAIKLQAAIIDILTAHHTTIMTGEIGKLGALGWCRMDAALDPYHHLDLAAAVQEVLAVTVGTPWEEIFKHEDSINQLMFLLRKDFASVMDIERGWHRSRNPQPAPGTAVPVDSMPDSKPSLLDRALNMIGVK